MTIPLVTITQESMAGFKALVTIKDVVVEEWYGSIKEMLLQTALEEANRNGYTFINAIVNGETFNNLPTK